MSGWRKKQIERLRMTKDEALKLALSTLNEVRQETFRLMRDGQTLYAEEKVWSTIISIKKALAQEQEPVAWGFQNTAITGSNRWTMLREEVPADDQYNGALWTPLYTTPPQRTWVGLTLDDIPDDDTNNLDFYRGGRWAERVLKEKNNG